MNYMKILVYFSLGIIVGCFIFSKNYKSASPDDKETDHSISDLRQEDLTKLKEELSSCERREQIASNALSQVQEKFSQESAARDKGIKGEGGSTSKSAIDHSNESDFNRTENHDHATHGKDIKPETYSKDKSDFLKSANWIDAEKGLDNLVKGDANSQSTFLKKVSITDFDKVLNFSEQVDRSSQNFIALQGSYQGQMKDLVIGGKEYRLELELNFPTQGDGTYSAKVEGEGLNLSTQGRGEAKGFSTLKDTGSRAVFLKLNRDVYLQLYSTGKSNTVIGNAYRNLDKGFAKFGEFELVRM